MNMEDIVLIAAQLCGYSFDDVVGRSKRERLSIVRQLIWRMLYQSGMSYGQIGEMFGRSHVSVLYGVNRVEDMVSIGDRLTVELSRKVDEAVM